MKPSEFWSSTYRELSVFVNANSLQREQEFKQDIVLFNALGDKIIEVIGRKRPKNINLVRDVFKELFKEELEPSVPHQQTIEDSKLVCTPDYVAPESIISFQFS